MFNVAIVVVNHGIAFVHCYQKFKSILTSVLITKWFTFHYQFYPRKNGIDYLLSQCCMRGLKPCFTNEQCELSYWDGWCDTIVLQK